MAKHTMEDGVTIDTKKATASWQEDTYWDGNNHISKATGSQWDHETLYKSSKGRYYLVHNSQWQGSSPSAQFVEPRDAARWIISQDGELPDDLAHFLDEFTE